MVEPTSAVATVGALVRVAENLKRLVDDARKLAPEDVAYYGAWINIAKEAILGIEQEYIEILLEGKHCRLDDLEEKRRLARRLDDYITGEHLRPKLREAIDRLTVGRTSLESHAEQWLILPRVRRDRATALSEYDELLNSIRGYLGSLGDYDRNSARDLEDLYRLQDLLEAGDIQGFKQEVTKLAKNPEKTSCALATSECARVIEKLRLAFR
jgi:hypothetical protein